MILFMARLSVSEAAQRLGVNAPRVRQRIADGSLPAERVGHQWVIDDAVLVRVAEQKSSGRPLSARSAWALIALSDGDRSAAGVSPAERVRARRRWVELSELAASALGSEDGRKQGAAALRKLLRNRAERRLYRAASSDLPDLRSDRRLQLAGLSRDSGLASGDIVEAYVHDDALASVIDDYLLSPAASGGNVVLHEVPADQAIYPESLLLLAADLVEHGGPREEKRAFELVRQAYHEERSR